MEFGKRFPTRFSLPFYLENIELRMYSWKYGKNDNGNYEDSPHLGTPPQVSPLLAAIDLAAAAVR